MDLFSIKELTLDFKKLCFCGFAHILCCFFYSSIQGQFRNQEPPLPSPCKVSLVFLFWIFDFDLDIFVRKGDLCVLKIPIHSQRRKNNLPLPISEIASNFPIFQWHLPLSYQTQPFDGQNPCPFQNKVNTKVFSKLNTLDLDLVLSLVILLGQLEKLCRGRFSVHK